METIGNRAFKELKNRARENGISVTNEALKLGITGHSLADWKHGKGNPSAYYLQQMALAGYDVVYILSGQRSPAVPGHDNQYNIAEMAYNNGYAKGLEDGKPKWISCKESLPKSTELVLAIDSEDLISTAYYTGKWHSMLDEDSITHWMPQPELPIEKP